MRRWVNPSQPDLLQIATWIGYFRGVFTLLFGLDAQFIVFPFSDAGRNGASNPLLQIALAGLLAGGAYLLANGRRLGWQLLLVGAALPLLARLLVAFGISLGGVDVGATSPLDYDVIGLIFEVALFALLVHPRSRQYEKVWLE
jgi:hypothetical protein